MPACASCGFGSAAPFRFCPECGAEQDAGVSREQRKTVTELLGEQIPGELRERITRAAGGNPLFVSEMLAMASHADGEVAVPPTLQALLAARLDQLEPAERGVLEAGSIEGEIFHRGAVQTLAHQEAHVTPRLASLVRKQLIRPDRPQIAGEDGFRFRHLLLRDTAYEALPKATRAELHRAFAGWLEQHGTDLVELDELLGYHLEQALRYQEELGLPRDDEPASRARIHLTSGGRRAMRDRRDHRHAARPGGRVRRPRRGAPARWQVRRRISGARAGARAVRAQGQSRLRRAHTRPARRPPRMTGCGG